MLFKVSPVQAGDSLEITHQNLPVAKLQSNRQRGVAEGKQLTDILELLVGRIDCLAAVKTGQTGHQAQTCGYPARVDGKPALATALGHEFEAHTAVRTRDEQFAEEISLMKFHGMNREAWKRYEASGTPNYDIVMPGFKYNMMDLQAALGIHQLAKLDGFIEKRTELAQYYNEAFAEVEEVVTPKLVPYPHRHAWHLYTPLIRIEALNIDRDGFMAKLKGENIGTGLHFKAIHHHPYFRELLQIPEGELPNADYASQRILSLPLFPLMTLDDANDVVAAVKTVIARHRR